MDKSKLEQASGAPAAARKRKSKPDPSYDGFGDTPKTLPSLGRVGLQMPCLGGRAIEIGVQSGASLAEREASRPGHDDSSPPLTFLCTRSAAFLVLYLMPLLMLPYRSSTNSRPAKPLEYNLPGICERHGH